MLILRAPQDCTHKVRHSEHPSEKITTSPRGLALSLAVSLDACILTRIKTSDEVVEDEADHGDANWIPCVAEMLEEVTETTESLGRRRAEMLEEFPLPKSFNLVSPHQTQINNTKRRKSTPLSSPKLRIFSLQLHFVSNLPEKDA
ncbi:plastid transcriptionally active 16 [Striga asiatica]|uniref:Plastid transcriptionally active 16 n=1 Tax=Striga asiatica TaxID=4170 RepID=A0A5A7P6C9_STRAF|nr:plastid transcriptionally active 16 [Striga asiatica]